VRTSRTAAKPYGRASLQLPRFEPGAGCDRNPVEKWHAAPRGLSLTHRELVSFLTDTVTRWADTRRSLAARTASAVSTEPADRSDDPEPFR
jgi:hypothetical protein